MKVGVVVFPGSNCDHDMEHAYGRLLGAKVSKIWHRDTSLGQVDLVVIPGGFSYGDYLRTGALASISPIMKAIKDFAAKGGPVIGICNGFQILCESQLLPGALLQNVNRKFISLFVNIKVDSQKSYFTKGVQVGTVISCPVAHGEGNYFASSEEIARLEGEGQVVFRYCDSSGLVNPSDLDSNPNGSINSIAGVTNPQGNVVGLMPHPERASEGLVGWIGGASGLPVLSSALSA